MENKSEFQKFFIEYLVGFGLSMAGAMMIRQQLIFTGVCTILAGLLSLYQVGRLLQTYKISDYVRYSCVGLLITGGLVYWMLNVEK